MAERRIGSTIIENVQPSVDGGRHPVKRIAGEDVRVCADIFKEGHDELVAVIRWRQVTPLRARTDWAEAPMVHTGNDTFEGSFPVHLNGRYVFTVEAWPDLFATWTKELARKVEAGREVGSELLEGAALLEDAAARAHAAKADGDRARLEAAAARLREGPSPGVLALALDDSLRATASRHPDRSLGTRYDRELEVFADRVKARTSAWYELFPRSTANDGRTHGTFQTAERWLPYVQRLGFDVLYLPPIHPIGRTARKGKNNALIAGPDDVGSPWAIGAKEGGHKAVHPQLGTLEDFRHFVDAARAHGIEVALDLAFQCSPDHPWITEHPEWFQHRPDGTIKTAENPPKRYEDIVNFDWLGPARSSLWEALLDVVLHWVAQGVRIFRVDNPHTKPLPFWEWLIRRVQDEHPDVIFLAEAFTRPKVMKALAKRGFSQSYTYFTWRNFKRELEEYLTELTQGPAAEYMRGNLWPNTPDILPEVLQHGGPPAFKLRAALAATLSSSWGIYAGYEHCENVPLRPGSEEYLDSEKYQLKQRDPDDPQSLGPYLSALNRFRRENPALKLYRDLRFFESDNDRVLCYGKATPDGANLVLCAVSLDPFEPEEATLTLPLSAWRIAADEVFEVHELFTDTRALWQGPRAHVRLTPEQPAALWRVTRFRTSEQSFDYFY
ncbi:MAG: alpha-1,4-glucan--maltose-1-phosphate maltosyltransferase [Myxococcaceae bacterium]|nr:alpha-1,4-glucan--maltose-1-phosphate maltosyltransferase [Myxococcaceae bacterium]